MTNIFKIHGVVREKESGIGIGNLMVKAYDKDLLYDDLMGNAFTRPDGTFVIVSEAEDFRDFFEKRPDIYLKIMTYDGKREIYSTDSCVRWEGRRVEYFEVDIPRDVLGDLSPSKEKKISAVEVAVYDYTSELLPNARVTLKPLEKKREKIRLQFDKQRHLWRAFDVTPGNYFLRAESKGYESDQRKVQVDPSGLKETFILGKKGMPFYYRGKVKVPFEPPGDLIGVSVRHALSAKEEEELLAYAKELKLQPEEVGKPIREDNVRVFRFLQRFSKKNKQRIQQRLSEHPLVRLVGPLISVDKERVLFLTNELVVKFKPYITEEEIFSVVKRYKLNIIRKMKYARNVFLLRLSTQASYDVLEICSEIVKSGVSEYAEPNLVETTVDLQINPTDFLYPQQWHIPIIRLQNAWQELRNANPPGVMPGNPGDLTFGSENIIIAVMDRGIESQTSLAGVTTAVHPDFNGTVTSGANKVYKFYDFANMDSNNDAPPNDHGMGCNGVASALANNPSVIAGEEEGVVGAAPNCRVMGLIRPAGGTRQQYADAYLWIAGFDPGWTIDGVNYQTGTVFPPVIYPGADIISNSFLMPTGGSMEDCFDYLTTHGRGGKGIPILVAAGNSNINVAVNNPMAAYEKTIAVAASSLANDGVTETKAAYSSFGIAIDVCAPSHDAYVGNNIVHNPPANYGIFSCDLIGQGNLAGHTGGGFDYRDNFGGTSSATPLTAGVVALMLSINPELTWVQVRNILRNTAIEIDSANTDPVGQWTTDIHGNPLFSQWYGYGRVDALRAVQRARDALACAAHLKRINALVLPGELRRFEVFKRDFCLTDIVLNLWTFPAGLDNSKASCHIGILNPTPGGPYSSELLFDCQIDKNGHQIHLNSGIFCPKDSNLWVSAGISSGGADGILRVLLSGYYCQR